VLTADRYASLLNARIQITERDDTRVPLAAEHSLYSTWKSCYRLSMRLTRKVIVADLCAILDRSMLELVFLFHFCPLYSQNRTARSTAGSSHPLRPLSIAEPPFLRPYTSWPAETLDAITSIGRSLGKRQRICPLRDDSRATGTVTRWTRWSDDRLALHSSATCCSSRRRSAAEPHS